MFGVLVRKEILNNLLDLRFGLAYFLCTLLIVGSSAHMLGGYLSARKTYDINSAVFQRRWHDTRSVWESGRNKLARRPLPTAIFVQGGEKDPDRMSVAVQHASPHFYGDYRRDPLTNLFPTFDMLFTVGVILSLLILLLTYDTISAERQGGTLRLLLSCPLPRVTVILAKWAGGFISLLIPFVTSLLIVTVILLSTRDASLSVDDWLRVIALFAVGGLYIAVVFSLSMMVSVLVRQSGLAILALLLVWVVAIVAIPSMATPLSYVYHNPPSVSVAETEMKRAGIARSAHYHDERQEYVAERMGGKDLKKLTREEHRELNRLNDEFWYHYLHVNRDSVLLACKAISRHERNVDATARLIARISPFGCFQNACISIAGTGLQRDVDLRASLEDYSQESFEYWLQTIRKHQQGDYHPAYGPRFTERRHSFASALSASLTDIGVLVLMGMLFIVVSFLLFIRADLL